MGDGGETQYVSRTYGRLYFDSELPNKSRIMHTHYLCGVMFQKCKDVPIQISKSAWKNTCLKRKYFLSESEKEVPSEHVRKVPVFYGACPTDPGKREEFFEYKKQHPGEHPECYMVRNAEGQKEMVHTLSSEDEVVTCEEFSRMLKPATTFVMDPKLKKMVPSVGPVFGIRCWVPLGEVDYSDMGRGDRYYACACGTKGVKDGAEVMYCRKKDVQNEAELRMNTELFGLLLKIMRRKSRGVVLSYQFRQGVYAKHFLGSPCHDNDGWMILMPWTYVNQRAALNQSKLKRPDPVCVGLFENLIRAKRLDSGVTRSMVQSVETSTSHCLEGSSSRFSVEETVENLRLLLSMNLDDSTRESLEEMLNLKLAETRENGGVRDDGTFDPDCCDRGRDAAEALFRYTHGLR